MKQHGCDKYHNLKRVKEVPKKLFEDAIDLKKHQRNLVD